MVFLTIILGLVNPHQALLQAQGRMHCQPHHKTCAGQDKNIMAPSSQLLNNGPEYWLWNDAIINKISTPLLDSYKHQN